MATEIGAASVGLETFYGHVLSRDAMENDDLWPYPQVDLICAQSLVVDRAGRRFADEGQGGIYLANVDAQDASLGFISAKTKTTMQSICWDPKGTWVAACGEDVVIAWDYPSRTERWRHEFMGEVFGAICYSPKLKLP